MDLLFAAFAVAAGLAASLQATTNAALAKIAGLGPTLVINSAIVLAGSAVIWLAGGARTPLFPSGLSWTYYLGGACGLLIIAAGAIVFPHLGAAWTIALIVFGQCVAALLIDHVGLMGMQAVPVTPQRIAGVALVASGVAVLRL